MSDSIICDRAFEFALRVVKLCGRLFEKGPAARHVASQLLRSGTSVGSNAEEAQEGQTKADYVAKMSVSRKEAREAIWWLRLAIRSGIVTDTDVEWELSEAKQLLAMIRSAILTSKSSPSRGDGV